MSWDESAVTRWLEPLAARPGEIAEVFSERLRERSLDWRDGQAGEGRVRHETGTGARWRHRGQEQLVFVAGIGESSAREAVRALRAAASAGPLPVRTARAAQDAEAAAGETPSASETDRWSRRLAAMLARHAPRHRFRWRIRETERRIVAAGRPASATTRRLVSLEGHFTAVSRLGDEDRAFCFHAPDAAGTADALNASLSEAAAARGRAGPVAGGETDVVLARGSAAVLFHEILGHPLEADASTSPLFALADARVAVSELEVHDDARRLDLFGGYEWDDEGTEPRLVRLIHSGRIGSRLTDRAHAGAAASSGHGRRAGPAETVLPRGSNILVAAGSATTEELSKRLDNGLWIEEISGGSVEMAAGTFRVAFPRARKVRRGRLADEVGPGILAGEILATLEAIEPVLGRDVHVCRNFGWCARDGQVVPVQGAAPDVLIRRIAVRSSS